MKLVLVSLFAVLLNVHCYGVTVTQVSRTVSNGSTGSISWTNLTSSTVADGVYTQGSTTFPNSSSISDKLFFQNFLFNIPSNATIEGIEVQMLRSNQQSNKLMDVSAYLLINGIELGNNKASTNPWSSTPNTEIYGSSTDLWGFGSSLDYTVVNSSTFGFSVQVYRTTNTGTPNQRPQIDYLQMSITYNTALPVDLISFMVQLDREGNRLISWSTATETNTKDYEVQRAGSNQDFKTIETVTAAGYSQSIRSYLTRDADGLDEQILYYRIKQKDQNGNFVYFDPISVAMSPNIDLHIFPNPASAFVSISGLDKPEEYQIVLMDLKGNTVLQGDMRHTNTLDVRSLEKQAYVLQIKHLPSGVIRIEKLAVR